MASQETGKFSLTCVCGTAAAVAEITPEAEAEGRRAFDEWLSNNREGVIDFVGLPDIPDLMRRFQRIKVGLRLPEAH